VGDVVVVILALAGLAALLIVGILWWYDTRSSNEWEDLLSPEARDAWTFLQRKFEAEERAAAFGCSVAAATGARFLVGLVPDRLQLLRRLELYARIMAAAAPAPRRVEVRLAVLRHGFASLSPAGDNTDELLRARLALRELDAQTLESCRIIALAVGEVRDG
jgi:hypothetical protein